MTTLSVLARPRVLLHRGPMRRGFILGFLLTLALGLLVMAGASATVAMSYADRVMPGVSVAGIQVGGLDRAGALARLEAELPSLGDGALILQVDDEQRQFTMADLGRSYDLEAAVEDAFAVARSGNPLTDGVTRVRTLAHPTALAGAAVVLDPSAIDEVVTSMVADYNHPSTSGTVERVKGKGFVATPGSAALTIDAADLRHTLADVLVAAHGDVTLTVPAAHFEPAVTTDEASAAATAANRMTGRPLGLKGGGQPLELTPRQLVGLMTFDELADGTWGTSVNERRLSKLLSPVADAVAMAPRNASFAWGSSGVVGFFPSEQGRRLKEKATIANVLAALEKRAAGSPQRDAALAFAVLAPEVSNAEARTVAPQMRLLSTWTTYYVPGEGNFWGANINIPANDLDGRVIAPGEWFEFWQGIGPVTLARGYGYGGAIIGGRSVANGALGGGICSTSTTLFNAAMRAGLEIGQRTNHSYYIDRYPVGLDATVLKTESYETDMTFRNDMANPIVIRGYGGNGFVRFDIWGIPDGRTVTLSAPTTSNHGTAIETTVVNPDLPPGTAVRVEYPHNGFDAVVTRWVRDASGNLLHQDTWYSHYRTVNGITEVGPSRG